MSRAQCDLPRLRPNTSEVFNMDDATLLGRRVRPERVEVERWALLAAQRMVLRTRAAEVEEVKQALIARRNRTEAAAPAAPLVSKAA